MRFSKICVYTVLCLTLVSGLVHAQDNGKRPIVFAASSLTSVLSEQAAYWSEKTGMPAPRLSFGASATMARQIQAGAPAHIYISANPVWSEMLEKSGHTLQRINIASNQLVLVIPKNLKPPLPFKATPAYFKQLLSGRHLAIADPQVAPAGAYARSYLKQARLWESVQQKIAYGQNVRQALRLAERGGLPAFVYKSDAIVSDNVSVLFEVPADMTDVILYQAALLKRAGTPSISFLTYLQTNEASTIWQKHGFSEIVSK